MLNDQEKVFHDVYRPGRCVHAHPDSQILQKIFEILLERVILPIQSAPVWSIPQPTHIYQGAPTDTYMGDNTQHQNIGISGRHSNHCGVEGDMCEKYGPRFLQTDESGIRNQVREFVDDAITINTPSFYESDETIKSWMDDFGISGELYQEISGHLDGHTIGQPNFETTFGAQEQFFVINEDMEFDRDTERTCQAEPFV
ncbi:hypothetical protein AYI69_g10314 [Smittium culicis]|uniref:Uncharacterized protein n=1 Tax=Smittium culicis TaxID=133412 RepID=A0A1R1X6J5_9FUNG|nr:hypothetical protein AYI69_g10314 [Smittium culicis]